MPEILEAISMYRGDSYPLDITIRNKTTKEPINLFGYTLKLTVDSKRNPVDETTRVFQLTGVVPDPITGKVIFTPSEANTDLPATTYYYDIQYTAGTVKRTIKKHKFIILQDLNK